MHTSLCTILVATFLGALTSCATPASTPSSPDPVVSSAPSSDASADGASLGTPNRDELPLPDGYLVAYTDATGVWLIEGAEAPRLLTPASDAGFPRIAPDGAHVAYWRLDQPPSIEGLPGRSLWIVDVDSGDAWEPLGTHDLPANDQGEPSFLGLQAVRWLPDGSGMTFETLSSLEMPRGNENIWRLDLESDSLTRLVPDGRAGAYAFSPDGEWIALGTNGWPHRDRGEISIVSADGGERRVIFEHPYLPGTGPPLPSASFEWARDSRSLRVMLPLRDGEGGFQEWWHGARWVRVGLDGTVEPIGDDRNTLDVALSPDWAHMIYIEQIEDPMQVSTVVAGLPSYPGPGEGPLPAQLVVAETDGSARQVYAEGAGLSIGGWSPDSRRFVYGDGRRGQVMLGGLEETPRALLPGLGIEQVRWIDSQHLMEVGDALRLTTLDGESRVLAQPSWSQNAAGSVDLVELSSVGATRR